MNDPDTGLVYMQARYYDPSVGRFISTDPVGPAVGNVFNFNRFAYVSNNPIVNTDPTGSQACSGNEISCDVGPTSLDTNKPSQTKSKSAKLRVTDSPGAKSATTLAGVNVTAPRIPTANPIAWGEHGGGLISLIRSASAPTIIIGGLWPATMNAPACEMPGGPKCGAVHNEHEQPDERDLTKLKERDGNKAAEEVGYEDAHDAKKGRGGGRVDIYNDKKTGERWLWNGVPGGEKEKL